MARPQPHTCSPDAAAYLSPIEHCRMWCWELRVKRRYEAKPVLVVSCPWCGRKLPCRLVEAS